ncbi:malate synthase G [Salisediminibacterium halotolerans]|uniref:Malate synthase G n=1 Tax=Salisediminibacterium halotolerans TaxID=517425 RepID=A0A1H9WAQ5_9BACI|nr:malate synthase G [Salisediminibacterium haloalkalitolerans]SES30990.1 malate synthase [Salisediminibacterium haloalkalitolerans]
MKSYSRRGNMQIADVFAAFLEEELLPKTKLDKELFWSGFEKLLTSFHERNKSLLKMRSDFQNRLDEYHRPEKGGVNKQAYQDWLEEIGYIEPLTEHFTVETKNLDPEVNTQAGPQLVVPVNNARYAINAANARWGSLYDSLYGTDVLNEEGGAERKADGYNPVRGEKVIAYSKTFLDETFPLASGTHHDVRRYYVANETLYSETAHETVQLKNRDQFQGFQGKMNEPSAILLKNNGLHIELQIDRSDRIGQDDPAGLKDIATEAATTTIMDFEDSVAAVDPEDKTEVYRHWLQLIDGTLTAAFYKNGKETKRALNPDRTYQSPFGGEGNLSLPGRSLMLVRNVGHLMTTDLVYLPNGEEAFEGLIDAVISGLTGYIDLSERGVYGNSKTGSVYIVKPKMHGSAEAAFTNELMTETEKLTGIPEHSIKVGVMDEERRTSLNLHNVINEVKERIFFINTGFLDRTGDDIHSVMASGPMIRKGEMKSSVWLDAYERANVYHGLQLNLHESGQIGKGMWAMPEEMARMMSEKGSQLEAGANTAWVPSPTAAVLHALHYHAVDTSAVQKRLQQTSENPADKMLEIPLSQRHFTAEEVEEELKNNAQGILGYVVRWVEQGVGCSKVPDINNVHLMEDRATLRISSQHMMNWLYHGVCTKEQVMRVMHEMAAVVDRQNEGDPAYEPMSVQPETSTAFQAALELVFTAKEQPNGYTEPILHRRRREYKEYIANKSKKGEMIQ